MTDFIAGCMAAVMVIILAPILLFAGGCLTGLILEWIVGDAVVNGLNILFNTTRFTSNMLPAFCGALAVVGSFFRNTVNKIKD